MVGSACRAVNAWPTASSFGQRYTPEEISGKAIDRAPRSAATLRDRPFADGVRVASLGGVREALASGVRQLGAVAVWSVVVSGGLQVGERGPACGVVVLLDGPESERELVCDVGS